MVMGPFFVQKTKKIDFEEKKFNVRFGECSFFYIKRPINIESHTYKVTNYDGMYFRCIFSIEDLLLFVILW